MASKRKQYSLETKYNAIMQVEKGVQKKVVAEDLGISASTLSTWLKAKDNTKAAYESGTFGSKTKRMKPGQYPKTEAAVVTWMRQARAANMSLSGTLIKIKAKKYSEDVGEHEFIPSNDWLCRFRKRHGIVYRKINGEAKSVDLSKVDDFRTNTLVQLLKDYPPENIYNGDETDTYIQDR